MPLSLTTCRRLLLILLVTAALVGCSGGGGDSPTAPAVPACQANNTADVNFQNRSGSGRSYVVVWDGAKLFNVAPGQTSPIVTVAAGVPHNLAFLFASNNKLACAPGSPVLAQCSAMTYWCER